MSEPGGKTSRPWEPQHYRQEAHSPEAKLPEGDVVFFRLDIVPQLDLRRFYAPYEHETRGAPPYDPAMMGCLLLYADCVGVFASRKIALACERHLAFLAMVGQERPDFRPISDFRQLPLEACKDVLVQVVRLAAAMGLVQLGHVSTDGTKIQGHASRPKAMSYGDRHKEVERVREDIEALVMQAHHQDEADNAALGSRRGEEWPAERARREERLARIEAAMRRLEVPAKAAADAERTRRAAAEAERRRTGQQRRGKAPKPVTERPEDKAQSNFTDPDLRSRRTNNKGWDDWGNAPASVDGACQIIVACDVREATNDKQPAAPFALATLAPLAQAGIERPKDARGVPQAIPATWDNGYDSEAAVDALVAVGFDPYIAPGRQRHHGAQAASPARPTTAQERMAAKVQTPAGKALYARRKVIVAPVFGQSKEGRGFRRFLLRGMDNIRGAWRLVCLTHNVLKMWR